MKCYIRSTGAITPQSSFTDEFPTAGRVTHTGNRWNCMEPDYGKIIDPKLIRRMSRIIRMGVASAMQCLQKAQEPSPHAILTGTAYGCLEDTEIFLKKMIENKEELLSPTSFIQSTHNTVGSQIALMIRCHRYNNTYVHRGFSFEHALLDACLLLEEDQGAKILVGGVDEITPTSHQLLDRFGLYKHSQVSDAGLLNDRNRGTVAGEGAIFFLVSGEKRDDDSACLQGLRTIYKPRGIPEIADRIAGFLKENSLSMPDIDLVLTGENGNPADDSIYEELGRTLFAGKSRIPFKPLCGEYPTAASFGLWLAANILQSGSVPGWVRNPGQANEPGTPKNLLIYNHYQNIHHSLYLLSAC